MNTYLIIGLIVLLVGVLVYSRRTRAATEAGDAVLAPPAPTPAPAPQAPLPRPAALRHEIAPAPAHSPPPPSNWIPEETIVEPGWPLPGEISGNWSPVATDTGAIGAVREDGPTTTAVVDRPVPVVETAPPVESPDEWLMPESPALSWPAPVDDPAPVAVAADPAPAPDPVAPAFAAETAATTWDTPVAEMDAPVWTPEPPQAPAWPAQEPEAARPEPEIPAVAEAAPPAPVVWNLDPPVAAPVAEEPEPEPEPAIAEWTTPEPVVAAEADPPAAIRDQSLAVADLAPLLEGLLPLTRISDRDGVTPRMLALMRALADGPLSVTEQARRLDVSRPVVADLSARLESRGLARRERDATDRRRVRIALTERGRRVCDEAPAADPTAIEAALSQMEPGERDGLMRGVRALERVAAAR